MTDFKMSYQEFSEVARKVMPFWQGRVDFSKLYSAIQFATPGKSFYFNDFLTLLILFAKFSFRKKMTLLFELYAAFNDTFRSKEDSNPHLSPRCFSYMNIQFSASLFKCRPWNYLIFI